MGTFTLTQVYFLRKNGTFTSLLWATLLSLLYLNEIQVKNASVYSKRAVYFSLGSNAVHSVNTKSDEDVAALDLQSIESKSAKACLQELYEDLLLDEHRVCCLLFHRYRPRYHYDITSLL